MKRILAGLLAAAVLIATGSALASPPTQAMTCNLGGTLDRVKLRAEPDTNASMLGQYFANVRFTVLEFGGDWWRVRIGDREGYMMSRFLTTEIPTEEPYTEGQSGFVCAPGETASTPLYAAADTQATVLAAAGYGALYVLGTVGENWLQVRYRQEGAEPVTGYVSSADISMAENFATIAVDTGKAAERLNLRTKPDRNAASLGLFYSGTVLNCLFDNHVNGDGWTRVRIGDMVGYMADDFLSFFSSAGYCRYRPPLSGTRYPYLPIFATKDAEAAFDSVTDSDVFAVLGECGARYYIQIRTDQPNQYRYGFIEKKYVREADASVSTGGTLKTDQPLYFQHNEGKPEPSGINAAAGTRVWIVGSLTEPETNFPYVDTTSGWLRCIVEAESGETYALIPRDVVLYDAALEY